MYGHAAHLLSEDEARAALAAFDRASILVVPGPDGLAAVHLPLLLAGDRLIGHVARENPIWRAAPCAALAICKGAEADRKSVV